MIIRVYFCKYIFAWEKYISDEGWRLSILFIEIEVTR